MNNNGMSDFLKIAIKSGRVKDVKEAFMDYPVEEEWHKGKIENVSHLEEESEDVVSQVQVPDVMGKSLKEAEQILKENNLEMSIDNEEIDKENTYVKNQIPSGGITVNEKSKVIIE